MPNVPQIEAQRKRVRFGGEETPRPAKKPRRKAGLRAKRGVSELEQVTGIEPACSAWEADILPLNYTCKVILLFANYAIIAWNTIKVKAFLNRGDRYQITPSGLAGGGDSYVQIGAGVCASSRIAARAAAKAAAAIKRAIPADSRAPFARHTSRAHSTHARDTNRAIPRLFQSHASS